MGTNPYHLVDVFAERPYAGNQLAVVRDAASLSTDEMQAIAAEFGFSETTFVEADEPRDGGYPVRIFTPREEIPFAGHPALGTAAVLRDVVDAGDEIGLDLDVGRVPVRVDDENGADVFWMRQRPPTFGETFERESAAAVLSLDADDVRTQWPVQSVSTGLPTVVVPLTDRDALTRIVVDRAAYDDFVAGHDAKNVLVFCPDARDGENDLAVRVFAPYYGVPEDPATGSSNGCLAGYLARHRCLDGTEVDVRVEQGYEMGRPSLLSLRARGGESEVEVEVGGSVIAVGDGRLR